MAVPLVVLGVRVPTNHVCLCNGVIVAVPLVVLGSLGLPTGGHAEIAGLLVSTTAAPARPALPR